MNANEIWDLQLPAIKLLFFSLLPPFKLLVHAVTLGEIKQSILTLNS